MAIKLYYIDFKNFGDALSPKLVEHLSGQSVIHAGPNDGDMMGVGSIFFSGEMFFGEKGSLLSRNRLKAVYHSVRNHSVRPIKVWGSGFWKEPIRVENAAGYRALDIKAVRGKLTLAALRNFGCKVSDNIVLGDPGLLYIDLVPGIRNVRKEYDVAVVPHYVDKEAGEHVYRRLLARGVKARLVDVFQGDPLQVLKDIASAESVISSSMHGLIVADSLGIPNRYLRLSDKIDAFKFKDYYSAFGLDMPTPLCVDDDIMNNLPRNQYVALEAIEQCRNDLLSAFKECMGA